MLLSKRAVDVGDGPEVDVLDTEDVDDEDDGGNGDADGVNVIPELFVATGAVEAECDPEKLTQTITGS